MNGPLAPYAATALGDLMDMRRRHDGSLDIDQYECQARNLRSRFLTKLFAEFIRRWLGTGHGSGDAD